MHFGEHLMLDGYGGNPDKLNDKQKVLEFLDKLPDEIEMEKISKPIIKEFSGNNKKDPGGFSGFVMIAESHLSIHTFPKRKFVSADVYTCKNGLNREFVIDYLKKLFDLEDLEINFVKRGIRYPTCNIK